MKIAIVPWSEKFCKNQMFDVHSDANVNDQMIPYVEMKESLEHEGVELNTYDMYPNLNAVDYIVFLDYFPELLIRFIENGWSSKLIYNNGEPDTVNPRNCREGFSILLRYFRYILTWDKDLVDNDRIFYRTIPYSFCNHWSNVPYVERKLITSISANKSSTGKNQIYSAREELITYFEKNYPNQFDMYGVGWDKNIHPSYKGSPISKFDVYANYRFALALENTRHVRGYVTEKIFDCLTSGIVPIYMGAEDINEYVPDSCFIDYRNFAGPLELGHYLQSVDEKRYCEYLFCINDFLENKKDMQERFSGDEYARNLMKICNTNQHEDFVVKESDLWRLKINMVNEKARQGVKQTIKRIVTQ